MCVWETERCCVTLKRETIQTLCVTIWKYTLQYESTNETTCESCLFPPSAFFLQEQLTPKKYNKKQAKNLLHEFGVPSFREQLTARGNTGKVRRLVKRFPRLLLPRSLTLSSASPLPSIPRREYLSCVYCAQGDTDGATHLRKSLMKKASLTHTHSLFERCLSQTDVGGGGGNRQEF